MNDNYFEEVFANFGRAMDSAVRIIAETISQFADKFADAFRAAYPLAVNAAMENPAAVKRWAKEHDPALYRKYKLAKKPKTKEAFLRAAAFAYCVCGEE